jgi:hypothetical protein
MKEDPRRRVSLLAEDVQNAVLSLLTAIEKQDIPGVQVKITLHYPQPPRRSVTRGIGTLWSVDFFEEDEV